jgi:hypothetical protein
LYSLHTLDAVISGDFPMLASGWLPPFPGGLSGPTGFLQRISTSGYPIVSFLSGFILTLYAGFELELAEAEGYGARETIDLPTLRVLLFNNTGPF